MQITLSTRDICITAALFCCYTLSGSGTEDATPVKAIIARKVEQEPAVVRQMQERQEIGIHWDASKKPIPWISVTHLLAHPEKFNNKKVRVVGYLHHKFEDHNLYMTKDDADHLNLCNALHLGYCDNVNITGLNITPCTMNAVDEHFVTITGTFQMSKYFYEGGYFGPMQIGGLGYCESAYVEENWYPNP